LRWAWRTNYIEQERNLAMNIDQLIFVGLNGYAVALDRNTGEIVWSNDQMKSGYVSLLLDGDRLIASTNGYIYCLDPLTGQILWNNPLRGYGMGAPTALVSVRGQSSQTLTQQAAEAITAAAASTSVTASAS
jgi:outer membrane protein assembly factor BamB